MSYEYRVFMVHQATESTFLHLAAERLRDGMVVEVERPGSELDGRSVIVYSVLTHGGHPRSRPWSARDPLYAHGWAGVGVPP